MADQADRSWLMRKLENAIQRGFLRAYHQVRVDPARFLMQLRSAHGLPIRARRRLSTGPELLDSVAEETIRSGMRLAALQGADSAWAGSSLSFPT